MPSSTRKPPHTTSSTANPAAEWIAAQTFRCVPLQGKPFVATARIAKPVLVPASDECASFARCRVSLTPIAAERAGGGNNEFQALCLSLDFIRNALKTFVAEGGRVYFGDSDSPANLDSPWFAPLLSLAELQGTKAVGRKRSVNER
jgi:hypothetical protein